VKTEHCLVGFEELPVSVRAACLPVRVKFGWDMMIKTQVNAELMVPGPDSRHATMVCCLVSSGPEILEDDLTIYPTTLFDLRVMGKDFDYGGVK